MSLEARSVYRDILDAHYASEDCTVPANEETLAALGGATKAQWKRVRGMILPFLPEIGDGKRQNKRCKLEWDKGMQARERQRSNGTKGAAVRWQGHSDAMPTPKPLDSLPSPSPSPSPTEREETPLPPKGGKTSRSVDSWRKKTAKRLALLTGSSVKVCLDQIASALALGLSEKDVADEVEARGAGCANAWDWLKAVKAARGLLNTNGHVGNGELSQQERERLAREMNCLPEHVSKDRDGVVRVFIPNKPESGS